MTVGRVLAGIAVAVLTALPCACGSVPVGKDAKSETPSFSGSWAAEYRRYYERAKVAGNDFAMEALADGTLSEGEMQEATNRWTGCMTEKRYTILSRSLSGGGDTAVAPDTMHNPAALDAWDRRYAIDDRACMESSGLEYMQVLWVGERADPGKDVDAAAIVRCLRRHEVVDESISDDELIEALTDDKPFPWTDHGASSPERDEEKARWLSECTVNPLELEY